MKLFPKHLFLFSALLTFLFSSCDKNEGTSEPVNQRPSEFSVVILTKGANHTKIKWEESEDPEGSEVYFNIYLNNEIVASNLLFTDYTFYGLLPSTYYVIKIEALDDKGASTFTEVYYTTNENTPPSPFEVSLNYADTTFAEIAWTEAIDYDFTTVFYDVWLNDSLVSEAITQRVFLFEGLDKSTGYYGKIVAKDEYGGESSAFYNFTTGK